MRFRIRLHGHLPWYYKKDEAQLELEFQEYPTLAEILKRLEVPLEEVAVASVDGRRCDWNCTPSEGETIEFFPILSGG
jgi:sulfur carrier protein ThiS